MGDGLHFEVFESPGHSRCSLMAYAPEQKWLFPSDSLPMPCDSGKRLMCTASESYSAYINSLRKLENRSIDLCAWEHFGYVTGDEASRIIHDAIGVTLEYKGILQEKAREWLNVTGFKFLPYAVMVHISRNMVINALEEDVV